MKNTFVRYIKIFLGIIMAYFLVIIVVNWAIDPLNEFGRNKIGLFFATERQGLKNIDKEAHNALLLGTSKIAAINAEELHCYDFFNASFMDALPEEMYFVLKRYLKDQKFVAIGLDFHVFNERQWPLLDLQEWPEHYFGFLEYLLSFKTFKYSVETVQKWKESQGLGNLTAITKLFEVLGDKDLQDTNQPLADSEKNQTTDTSPLLSPQKEQVDLVWDDEEKRKAAEAAADYGKVIWTLREHHFRRFESSTQRLEYLKKIKKILEDKNVSYVIFINPFNDVVLDLLKENENYQIFLNWKKEVKKIFPEVADFSESEYSHPIYYAPTDPFHFHNRVGVKFLNGIIDCSP